jgi:hypothetical protein
MKKIKSNQIKINEISDSRCDKNMGPLIAGRFVRAIGINKNDLMKKSKLNKNEDLKNE